MEQNKRTKSIEKKKVPSEWAKNRDRSGNTVFNRRRSGEIKISNSNVWNKPQAILAV